MNTVIKLFCIGLLIAGCVFFYSSATPDPVTISWKKPSSRVDGSQLKPNEIGHYTLYHNGEPSLQIDSKKTRIQYDLAVFGQHCFELSTTDTDGLTGPKSDQVCVNR